jgi:hypothetical protein
LSDKLEQAISLIKSGQKQQASQLLAELLKIDSKNETAWLWMSLAVNDKQQQLYCLKKVLAINPNNPSAQKALAHLNQPLPNQPSPRPFSEPAPYHIPETPPPPPTPGLSAAAPGQPKPNLALGCMGGLLAAGLGAALWTIISLITHYQIGWMAVGVGFLVGFLVRVFGRGNSPTFGVIGAALALSGCLLGNYLMIGILSARELGIPTIKLLADVGVMIALLKVFFHPMDILFYLIALYEGFRFSFK